MPPKPDEVLILSDDACDPCRQLKDLLRGAPGVRFLDLASDEAQGLLGDADRVAIPMAFVRRGREHTVCDLASDGQSVVLDCGGETLTLKE